MLRSLKKDTSLRSISNVFDKGYDCRKRKTFEKIENGACTPWKDLTEEQKILSNRDSRLLSEIACTDSNGVDIAGSVCDYYVDSDGDEAIVFISVKVPYRSTDAEEAESKSLIANAAIRRPMSIVKTQVTADNSMCSISCNTAVRPHLEDANGTNTNVEFPECAGFASGSQNPEYFAKNIHTAKTEIKIKNYGPGVLHGIRFLKEDIDPKGNLLLGRSMLPFSGDLEPSHTNPDPNNVSLNSDGAAIIEHHTPCYYPNFYKPSLQTASCDCEKAIGSGAVNTAQGAACKKGQSVCASTTTPTVNKNVFAGTAPGVLQDSSTEHFARKSLSSNLPAPESLEDLSPVYNSIMTVFEHPCKTATINCEFNRLQDDQTSPVSTWSFQSYTGAAGTNPTGRKTPTLSDLKNFPSSQKTVYPAANQGFSPLSEPDRF